MRQTGKDRTQKDRRKLTLLVNAGEGITIDQALDRLVDSWRCTRVQALWRDEMLRLERRCVRSGFLSSDLGSLLRLVDLACAIHGNGRRVGRSGDLDLFLLLPRFSLRCTLVCEEVSERGDVDTHELELRREIRIVHLSRLEGSV